MSVSFLKKLTEKEFNWNTWSFFFNNLLIYIYPTFLKYANFILVLDCFSKTLIYTINILHVYLFPLNMFEISIVYKWKFSFPLPVAKGKSQNNWHITTAINPSFSVLLQMTVKNLMSCWLRYAAQTSSQIQCKILVTQVAARQNLNVYI